MASPDKSYYEKLVYETLYPKADSKDPRSFEDFVRKYILREVRWENVRYYGSETVRGEELDALYPGHDYSSAVARVRLGQFYSHRRLFEAFEQLRLKPWEIDLLCTWEGTKSAKDRYEAERGIKVIDEMWRSFSPPPAHRSPKVTHHYYPAPQPKRRESRSRSVSPSRSLSPRRFATPPRQITRDYYSDRTIWGAPSPFLVQEIVLHNPFLVPAPAPITTPTFNGYLSPPRPAPQPGDFQHRQEWLVRNGPRAALFYPGNPGFRSHPVPHLPMPPTPPATRRPQPGQFSPAVYDAPRRAPRRTSTRDTTAIRRSMDTSPTPLARSLLGTQELLGQRRNLRVEQAIRARTLRALGERSLGEISDRDLESSYQDLRVQRAGGPA